MSDQPDHQSQDMLDEIMDRSQPKDQAPGSPPPPEKKKSGDGRTTPVYIYLAILFAAAFAMLLLAYFVQQRNNEAAMSDLRDSVSRFQSIDELRNENEELRAENDGMEDRIDELEDSLAELQRQYDELSGQYEQMEESAAGMADAYYSLQAELNSLTRYKALEECYAARDYESCAALVVMHVSSESDAADDWPAERSQQIISDLIRRGALDKDYESHLEDYHDLVESYSAAHPEQFGEYE